MAIGKVESLRKSGTHDTSSSANSILRKSGEMGGMRGTGRMGGIGGMKFDFFYTAGTKHWPRRSD